MMKSIMFLSLLMAMGVNKLLHVYMYWSNEVMVGSPNILCREVMATGRFLCLLKFICKKTGGEVGGGECRHVKSGIAEWSAGKQSGARVS